MLTFRLTDKTRDYMHKINDGGGTLTDRALFIAKTEFRLLEELSAVAFLIGGDNQKEFVELTKPIRQWLHKDMKRLYEVMKPAKLEDVRVYPITTAGGLYEAKQRIKNLIGPLEEEEEDDE